MDFSSLDVYSLDCANWGVACLRFWLLCGGVQLVGWGSTPGFWIYSFQLSSKGACGGNSG